MGQRPRSRVPILRRYHDGVDDLLHHHWSRSGHAGAGVIVSLYRDRLQALHCGAGHPIRAHLLPSGLAWAD
eukprot:scaffold359_cov351-Pinguiococcus_pyrenoidosus.AAC.6